MSPMTGKDISRWLYSRFEQPNLPPGVAPDTTYSELYAALLDRYPHRDQLWTPKRPATLPNM